MSGVGPRAESEAGQDEFSESRCRERRTCPGCHVSPSWLCPPCLAASPGKWALGLFIFYTPGLRLRPDWLFATTVRALKEWG